MRAWFQLAFFAAACLSVTTASSLWAQAPGQAASLELTAAVAGALSWSEDDMGFPLVITLHNNGDTDAKNIAANAILIARPAAKAGRILHDLCPDGTTGGTQAGGKSLAPGSAMQIRFQSNTGVEDLEPETDAMPVLLLCAHYEFADGQHKSAVLYRVLHSDSCQGVQPIDRVTGDVPAQALKLEELGRSAN